jgi:NADPH:quinone reductase-like Zn-dependent oxidoreductase
VQEVGLLYCKVSHFANVQQSFLDAVAAGRLRVPLHRTYTLGDIRIAHADMEANNATDKLAVVLSPGARS